MSSRRTSAQPHGFAPIQEEPVPAAVLVSELAPVGVVSADGRMLALRFRNPSGGPQTNVMAYTKDIAPGAMVYQGSTDGFDHVHEIVCLVGNTDTVTGEAQPPGQRRHGAGFASFVFGPQIKGRGGPCRLASEPLAEETKESKSMACS
ncbi:hypothetical protein CEP51_014896 [Fusarium floridanum]|uniref:Uncharacterized protein n=1 Tax=Fusarium floridanum TaxID=1325733 RepID=A0A428PK47_9HYPO|nr:hypothetical protein CEP51_014896 [Fusarium floridanum]